MFSPLLAAAVGSSLSLDDVIVPSSCSGVQCLTEEVRHVNLAGSRRKFEGHDGQRMSAPPASTRGTRCSPRSARQLAGRPGWPCAFNIVGGVRFHLNTPALSSNLTPETLFAKPPP